MNPNLQTIYLAGGCFWGMQAYFAGVQGVTDTQVGYANGSTPNPTYQEVCSGTTGYAETIKIVYNEAQVPAEFLIGLYLDVIDPTVLNRQGNDIGTQYRTGIYYTTPRQEQAARRLLEQTQRKLNKPVVTEVLPLTRFYPAEEYHQNYLRKNPGGYCHISKQQINRAHAAQYIDLDSLRSRLTPLQYRVTMQGDTEPPFRNEYYNNFRKGIYVDVISGTPLFLSTDKFESGCGWPAFSRPINEEMITERQDNSHGMSRTEVKSKQSGAHLGHVFEDGPAETGGLRYCINSASLRFIPLEDMAAQGYEAYIPLLDNP